MDNMEEPVTREQQEDLVAKKNAYFEINKKLVFEIWKKYHKKLK